MSDKPRYERLFESIIGDAHTSSPAAVPIIEALSVIAMELHDLNVAASMLLQGEQPEPRESDD